MKKKIVGIIIIIVLVLGIGAGVVYKIIEKEVTDRETFDFETDTNGSNDTVSHDEHSFYGKIIEVSSSYIIVEPNENEEERKSSDKFSVKLKKDNTTYKVGDNVKITYIGDINESYPAQIGTTNIEIVKDFDFYITKPQVHNDIRFNDYYTFDGRTIYLAGNLGELYIKEQDKDITLKTYLSTAFQTFDDGIKHITDKLELKETLRDGGTKIYKSKDKDITMIVCNTSKNDKNILIGDYSMEYIEGDCKN